MVLEQTISDRWVVVVSIADSYGVSLALEVLHDLIVVFMNLPIGEDVYEHIMAIRAEVLTESDGFEQERQLGLIFCGDGVQHTQVPIVGVMVQTSEGLLHLEQLIIGEGLLDEGNHVL